ncbi:MAG TPA: NAD(P)/FAD-dependent oxidoreductase [Vicinamibacterales bacterium]|nr:NAD(P)/FAD-dependent oxidoreductase [Vicinamibacterales bacterium]
MAARPRVIIIGGGFGGLTAARTLKRAPVDVTLLDRRNHHTFQPLLYQVATAGLSPGDIASPIRWILRHQSNVRVLLAEVQHIDVERRMVHIRSADSVTRSAAESGRSFTLDYDYLIVAAGATHAYFGHDEWRDRAPGLKTLDDALRIRRRVLLAFERAELEPDPERRRRLLTFVVVGGGATGVELAGALAELSRHALAHEFRSFHPDTARIVLLEGGRDVLSAFVPPLRAFALKSLEKLGIEVRTSAVVTAVDEDGVHIKAQAPSSEPQAPDERLRAGTVLWAAGVAAAPIGRALGAPVDRAGRVLVEPDLSLPGHPEVFIVGDLASVTQDGRLLPGVAPVAMQEGAYVARLIRGIARGSQPIPASRRPFRYHNPGDMATIGRAAAVADFGRFRLTGWIAWVAWLFVHILKLTGFRNRLLVLVQWAWAYFTYQRSIRLIAGEDRG